MPVSERTGGADSKEEKTCPNVCEKTNIQCLNDARITERLTQDLSAHSIFILLIERRHWNAPREITGDGAGSQSTSDTRIDDFSFAIYHSIGRPVSLFPRPLDPCLQFWLNNVKLDVHVRRRTCGNFVGDINKATRVDEVYGI
jgi:hypothetical protein